MNDYLSERIRKARMEFFTAAADFFRIERTLTCDMEWRADRSRAVENAFHKYADLLDAREAEELIDPLPKITFFDRALNTLNNFFLFWRWNKSARKHQESINKILRDRTPPTGGGPWG